MAVCDQLKTAGPPSWLNTRHCRDRRKLRATPLLIQLLTRPTEGRESEREGPRLQTLHCLRTNRSPAVATASRNRRARPSLRQWGCGLGAAKRGQSIDVLNRTKQLAMIRSE